MPVFQSLYIVYLGLRSKEWRFVTIIFLLYLVFAYYLVKEGYLGG
jgi:hypothetical protein